MLLLVAIFFKKNRKMLQDCRVKGSENFQVMFCAIWYHLYNLKNMKNTHGGVLLIVSLQLY